MKNFLQILCAALCIASGWMVGNSSLSAVGLDSFSQRDRLAGCHASEVLDAFQPMLASNSDTLRPVPVNSRAIKSHEADGVSILAMNNGDHCQIQSAIPGEHLTIDRERRHHACDPVRHIGQPTTFSGVEGEAVPVCAATVQLFGNVPAVKASAIPSPAMLQFAFHATIKTSRFGFVNS